ncbi:MAG: hypothetical protein JWM52_827 [Candidatus Saccharibacteria bacterium]|nr:hypothetical protein [Candidatus Saccharibacteria bacterium]
MDNGKKDTWYRPKNLFDKVFSAGILLKGIDGLIELIAAIALLFLTPVKIQSLVDFATHGELIEDPHDFIANLLLKSSQNLTNDARYFLIIYLLIHAIIKLVAVIGILRNKLWAYPFSLITLSLLAIYQIYDLIFVKPSILIVLLTILDLIILWLIWREYSTIRRQKTL